jgi:hypothetical protein
VDLLGQTLQSVGVVPLVRLEVLHAGFGLLRYDRGRRLVAPSVGIGRSGVVVEVQTVAVLSRVP